MKLCVAEADESWHEVLVLGSSRPQARTHARTHARSRSRYATLSAALLVLGGWCLRLWCCGG